TTILDEIFERVDKDKQKIDKFLKQINSDLQSMDEGIAESHKLHSEKQELDTSIDLKVTSEVHEMENMLSSQSGVEAVKTNVLGSLKTIRSHMETFKQQEQDRNKRAQAVTKELQGKLNQMENECSYLKQQVLEKHDHVLSDSLTGVRNRLAYEEAIQTECDRFSRYGRPLSLLVMSIDDFQNIGKHYGEGSGDMVLQVVAKILANSIRNVDFLARYGGEDFVIIFPELGMKDARLVGQKICKTIAEERIEIGGNKFNISISGGIARMHDDDNPKSLHERADSALTLAKQRGGNKVEIE
ncbi:MAG: GGDEF domain-containing protein, partial [Gammaproteobacteria bacterium]|nr:GGDEF domain-containing protein [Gammaproteobacteria bacterium]